MGSMSDGTALYANQGASAITGLPIEALERCPISTLYEVLCTTALNPVEGERHLSGVACAQAAEAVVELG